LTRWFFVVQIWNRSQTIYGDASPHLLQIPKRPILKRARPNGSGEVRVFLVHNDEVVEPLVLNGNLEGDFYRITVCDFFYELKHLLAGTAGNLYVVEQAEENIGVLFLFGRAQEKLSEKGLALLNPKSGVGIRDHFFISAANADCYTPWL